jgi:hypothetical protein
MLEEWNNGMAEVAERRQMDKFGLSAVKESSTQNNSMSTTHNLLKNTDVTDMYE